MILEALDPIFEAPNLDLRKVQERFFEIFDRFWVRFFEVVASQTKSQECQESQERQERPECKILPLNALSQVWVGGGVPPQGVFNGIGAKLAILGSQGAPKNHQNLIFWEQCVQDACQEAPKRLPRSPGQRFWKDFGWIWKPFFVIFGCE